MAISPMNLQGLFPQSQTSLLDYMLGDSTEGSCNVLLNPATQRALLAAQNAGSTTQQTDPFGQAADVNLSDEALQRLFGDNWKSVAEKLRGAKSNTSSSADTSKTSALDSALSKAGQTGKAAKAFLDDFFKGATGEEALSAKKGLEELLGGMKDLSLDSSTQQSLNRAVRSGAANGNAVYLKGSNGTLLRLEWSSDEKSGKTLHVIYNSTTDGSADVTLRRYSKETVSADGKTTKVEAFSSDSQTRKSLGNGRISRVPTDSAHVEGLF